MCIPCVRANSPYRIGLLARTLVSTEILKAAPVALVVVVRDDLPFVPDLIGRSFFAIIQFSHKISIATSFIVIVALAAVVVDGSIVVLLLGACALSYIYIPYVSVLTALVL